MRAVSGQLQVSDVPYFIPFVTCVHCVQAMAFGATDFLVSTDEEAMEAHALTFDVLLNTVSGIDDLSK